MTAYVLATQGYRYALMLKLKCRAFVSTGAPSCREVYICSLPVFVVRISCAIRYCEMMSQPAASPLDRSRWGGLPELVVFAHMKNVSVVIHDDASNLYVISPPGGVSFDRPAEAHLQWRGGNHYNFLEPAPDV